MAAQRVRILLVDDNPDDRQLAVRELARGLDDPDVTEAGDRAAFERALPGCPFDLVITDFQLKWGDGIGVLRAVKGTCPDVPVVMFTASGSEEVAVEAMKAGLDDYVIKSPRHFVRLNLAAQACLRKALAQRRANLLELRQQQLLNRLALGVCRVTLDGRLLEFNPAFLRLCGAASPDALGPATASALLPPAAHRDYLLGHPPDNGYHAEWEAMLPRAGGTGVSVAINATLSTAGAGSGERVLDCVVEDVTARKKLVDDLTAANRAKDQFLATVSHELRTPLTPVLAAVSAMEDDPRLPDDLRDDVRVVRRNVELEARLVNDLLELGGAAAGRLKLHFEAVDANAAAAEAADAVRRDAAAKGLRVELRPGAPSPFVWADPSRLRQVLAGLLANAVKFTGAGGTVTVSTTQSGGELLLSVADTGMGIAAEYLPHIFEAFNQGDVSVARRYGGLGLGLSVAKRIVDAHGGTLTAESAGGGRGATFTVRLKLVESHAAAAPEVPLPPADAGRPARRVLLVEDHDDTREVLSRLLGMSGCDVQTATNVAEALRALEAGRFDLLLSDLGLPDGTGWDLMRQAAGRWGVSGIALSGFGTEDDVRRSREAGFAAHLTKPVDLRRLEDALRRVER
jgi:DNA-binding response OmpR family regulator/anti-sigma regulatory factor (Ser/Thr protein kinase)